MLEALATHRRRCGKFSVRNHTVGRIVSDLDQAEREARKEKIKDLYLKAYTAEEIGEVIGSVDVVKKELPCLSEYVLKSTKVTFSEENLKSELSLISTELVKSSKVQFSDDTWTPPIYNVWSFAKKTNETSHFGVSIPCRRRYRK